MPRVMLTARVRAEMAARPAEAAKMEMRSGDHALAADGALGRGDSGNRHFLAEFLGRLDDGSRGGAEGVVHVQWEADQEALDGFICDEGLDGGESIMGGINGEDVVGGSELAALVAEGEAD